MKVLWQHVSTADKKICQTRLNWTPKYEEETERGKCSENCERGQILERAMNFGSQKWTTYFGNSFRSSDENYYQVFQKYSWQLLSCSTMWWVSQKIHFQTYKFISKKDTQMSLYKIHFVSRTIRDETRISHRN